MALEFAGAATPFSDGAIAEAADDLCVDVATIKAVIDVESRGGFLPDRRPKILFERHYFHRLTKRAHADQADICCEEPGGYTGGAGEHDRLQRAIRLNREAAIRSASWGAFQIMGDNFAEAGFRSAQAFCAAMCESEDAQLQAFVRYVKRRGLADELQRRDWAGFARGYNGPAYKKNRYDEKLAAAYAFHAKGGARADPHGPPRSLRMGDEGPEVIRLQEKLGISPDGDFGPTTKQAVLDYQRRNGLAPDGVVGPRMRQALQL